MQARNDKSTAPIHELDKPLYVLRMNWWHFSDANRIKWLHELRHALARTQKKVATEIARLEKAERDRKTNEVLFP